MNQNIGVLERNVDSIESIRVTDLTFLSYFLLKTSVFLPLFLQNIHPRCQADLSAAGVADAPET